jgi:hypothetical protein
MAGNAYSRWLVFQHCHVLTLRGAKRHEKT